MWENSVNIGYVVSGLLIKFIEHNGGVVFVKYKKFVCGG